MIKPVRLSTYSLILSIVCVAVLGSCCFFEVSKGLFWQSLVLIGMVAALGVSVLLYMPRAVSVDDDNLCVHRILRTTVIPLDSIESVKLCPPTMGARRICASGGLFGYWGWYSERDLGRYFAYYGRSGDCFLVTLRDGRRYMLGCRHPHLVVNYLEIHLPV